MSDRFSLSFLCLGLAFFAAMPASAQKAPQVSKTEAAPSAQEDQAPQPEPPKSVLNVEIKNDLLSVELENINFGAAIKAVADKAGFKIEGTGEVFSRKLNTRFTDIEVERGVLRLLTLVKESNFTLHYDIKGLISKLEIFGISTEKAPSAAAKQPLRPAPPVRQTSVSPNTPQVQRPATVSPNMPQPRQPSVSPSPVTRQSQPVVRRRPAPSRPIPPQPAAQPSDAAKPQAAEEDEEEEESVDEIPYVAPHQKLPPGRSGKP